MATTAADGNKNQGMLKGPPENGPPSQADYAQWAAAMQAYYSGGPQFFQNAASSSPSPHPFPFAWGSQYPYGGPSPYAPPLAMFPHPGVGQQQGAGAPSYSHVPPASSLGPDSTTLRPKPVVRGSGAEDSKPAGTPTKGRGDDAATDVKEENGTDFPASFKEANGNGESGQEKEERHMSGLTMLRKRSYEHMNEAGLLPNGLDAPPHNAAGAFAAPAAGAFNPSSNTGATHNGGNGTQESWLQDEREVKRQRRKQSNRESARRSRLRKQAECEELGTRVDGLQLDNCQLKNELTNVSELLKQISEEHKRLVEEFTRATGKRANTTFDMEMVKKVLNRASELVQQQSNDPKSGQRIGEGAPAIKAAAGN